MAFKFGSTSKQRLHTCHVDMQKIMNMAISVSDIDFGIAEGHRSVALQKKYFLEGKSKIDGVNRLGKHNYKPSLAADIYLWINGKAKWQNEDLSYLAGVIQTCATLLHRQGKISHVIRWGGNWDMDGEILYDQSFDDRPHFELVNA